MAFDRTNPDDLVLLRNEVLTDPLALGYDPLGGTSDIINILNTKNPIFIINKPKISAAKVRASCTYDAYNALTADAQEWLRWITGSNGFNEESLDVTTDLRARLTDGSNSIWAVGDRSIMNATMLSLIDVVGSRAEDLFGYGTIISDTDWFMARDSQ